MVMCLRNQIIADSVMLRERYMSLRLMLTVISIVALPACATVDFSSMTEKQVPSARPTIQKTVVERSVNRLHKAFLNQSLCVRTNENRMERAAQIILKGMDNVNNSESVSTAAYIQSLEGTSALKSDIRFATLQINKTITAADVFLDTAPAELSLRKDLQHLERALIVSREVETRLQEASLKLGLALNDTDWTALDASISSLSDVTDQYGSRVRMFERAPKSFTGSNAAS